MPSGVREAPNCAVALKDYRAVVKSWLQGIATLDVKVPRLARDIRQVTPAMLLSALPLISDLQRIGIANLVVQGTKLEQAFMEEFAKNELLIGSYPKDSIAFDLTNHIQQLLSMLRYMVREDKYDGIGRPVCACVPACVCV